MGGHIPAVLVLRLKQYGKVRTFVETGTYQANTALWAAYFFDKVITIERSELLYKDVVSRYNSVSNIEFVLGDSRVCLPEIISKMQTATIFWLDAHYSGGGTVGADAECPLLAELDAIVASGCMHYILIDDAHMFTTSPPAPHDPTHWPTYAAIELILRQRGYSVKIVGDVIVAMPQDAAREAYL